MYRVLASGVFWGVLSSVIFLVAQFGLTLAVGKKSAELLGLLNVIDMTNAGFVAFFLAGGNVSLTNHINRYKGQGIAPVIAANVGLAVVGSSVALLGLHLLNIDLGYRWDFILTFIVLGILWLLLNQMSIDKAAHYDFRMSSILEKGAGLVVSVVLITFATLDYLSYAIVLRTVLVAYLAVLLYGMRSYIPLVNCRWAWPRNYYSADVWFLTLTFVVIFIYERVDQVLVLHYFSLETLGMYYVCFKMSFSVRLLAKIIVKAAYPLMSKMEQQEQRQSDDVALLVLRLNYVVTFVAAVALMLSGRFLLGLYGEEFQGFRLVLIILAATLVCSIFNLVAGNVVNAKGRGRKYFAVSVITVIVQVLVLVVFVPKLGIEAMAIAKLTAVLVGNLLNVYMVYSVGVRNRPLLVSVLAYTICTLGIAIGVALQGALMIAVAALLLGGALISRDCWYMYRLWRVRSA